MRNSAMPGESRLDRMLLQPFRPAPASDAPLPHQERR